jgi:hypothetical protein
VIDISSELDKNTREFKGIINSKHVTTVEQMVEYIARYGIQYLPDEMVDDRVREANQHIQQAKVLLEGSVERLISLRPQVEKALDLNREQRIMLQQVRDVFK